MGTKSTKEEHTVDIATKKQDHPARLNFSNSQQREAHIHAFLAWLPKILQEAPGIRWERLSSQVMGYLIRTVADSPDAVWITLAVGCAMGGQKSKVLYSACTALTQLLKRLRSQYGMTTLDELGDRSVWDRFVEGRMISGGDLTKLKRYEAFASTHRQSFESGFTERQRVIWKPFLLPPLPRGFIDNKAQRKAVVTASENQRKERSDVVLPLFPLLVEIAQLRKQAAERLIKEFRKQRDRAIAGEIKLPYQFQYVDRQFSVSEHATSLSEVQLVEREVTLSLTLWDRIQWVEKHPEIYKPWVRWKAKQQRNAYMPERNAYFLQYEGPTSDLLWCGDLIEKQLLGNYRRQGFVVSRPALLSPADSDANWLASARRHSGAVLFEPESLYRGTLFAAALATISLTNGSRVSELLQVSASDLVPEPYFFQWAVSQDGRVGHLCPQDVGHLLRFLFHGLTLTTRTGEPIRIAPHLLRHVLATHARTVQNIPAEALAYLLHHRVTLPDSTRALTIPEATAYYSRLPVAKLLTLLFEVQSTLVSGQGHSYLQVPPLQTLEQGDEALRKQFERCGMIGPTVLGYYSAGICVRPDNRGICANCPYLVPHYSNLPKAKTWRELYVLQAKLHDDQGHAVDAEQARKVIQYLDDMIRMMEIQICTRQDGGYLPFADTLPPTQEDEGDEL